MNNWQHRLLMEPLVLLALCLAAVPIIGGDFFAYQIGLFLIYGIATQWVALCWGRLGFLPLDHALFFGLGDPLWFHTDSEAASDGRFGGLIASGWHTCSIAMRLIAESVLKGSESFASPGLAYVKWTNPVRPGDSLRLRAAVLEQRMSKSQPSVGILRWRWRLLNSYEIEVLDLEATSLFDLSRNLSDLTEMPNATNDF